MPSGSYILTYEDSKAAFRKVDGTTNFVTANHAYLTADTTAPQLTIDFGETTGIKAIDNLTISQSDNYYDLSGRKLSNSQIQKGVYIVNGKKIVIK